MGKMETTINNTHETHTRATRSQCLTRQFTVERRLVGRVRSPTVANWNKTLKNYIIIINIKSQWLELESISAV